MTPREIIRAIMAHQPCERMGLTFDRGRQNDFLHVGPGQPANYTPRRWEEGPVEYYDDMWGNLWKRMVGGCAKGEICKPVLEDWHALKAIEPPRYDLETITARYRERFADDADGRYRVAEVTGWIFNDARYMRGMAQYFMDMALHPEELIELHRLIASVKEDLIHCAGRAGADAIMTFEDMGTQTGLLFSPEMFRSFFKDEYTRLFGIAHDYGMKVLFHSCGSNREILEDMCDVGIDCFQFDQPLAYDLDELAELFTARTRVLWSPVDIQKVMPTGNRELIEQETRRMCNVFRGMLICKNYPDLKGIGVEQEWDDWAYNTMLEVAEEWQT